MNILVTFLSWLTISMLLSPTSARADDLTYQLIPQKVAENVYVFIGSTQHFNRKNGGNIVNTGFIIAENGVIVIDTGPSLKYGQEMQQAIQKFTSKPVTHVFLTHHHPDHFLGNQAFHNAEIFALPATIAAIKTEGEGLLDNMYRMVGDWMKNTHIVNADNTINVSRTHIAGRLLQFIPLHGHTAGDLAILDIKTGTLFAGDLAFYNRTPTTPHAHVNSWQRAIKQLQDIPYHTIVPGHGPLDKNGASLTQTLSYLDWLQATLQQAAEDGLEMTEVMRLNKPAAFQKFSVLDKEFERSVAHLWPTLVEQTLPPVH